jgi:CxxC-x17-CxxC domain-containing protein
MGNFGRDNRGGGRSFGGNRGGFGGGRDRGGFGGGRGGFGGGDDSGRREMFSATCSSCGKDCQVPFRPTNGKPVYCSDCFEKVNGGRDNSRRPERSDFRPQGGQGFDQNKAQLDAINVKLDRILSIIAPTSAVKEIKEEKKETPKVEKVIIKEVKAEEAKPEKAKKVVKKVASKKK